MSIKITLNNLKTGKENCQRQENVKSGNDQRPKLLDDVLTRGKTSQQQEDDLKKQRKDDNQFDVKRSMEIKSSNLKEAAKYMNKSNNQAQDPNDYKKKSKSGRRSSQEFKNGEISSIPDDNSNRNISSPNFKKNPDKFNSPTSNGNRMKSPTRVSNGESDLITSPTANPDSAKQRMVSPKRIYTGKGANRPEDIIVSPSLVVKKKKAAIEEIPVNSNYYKKKAELLAQQEALALRNRKPKSDKIDFRSLLIKKKGDNKSNLDTQDGVLNSPKSSNSRGRFLSPNEKRIPTDIKAFQNKKNQQPDNILNDKKSGQELISNIEKRPQSPISSPTKRFLDKNTTINSKDPEKNISPLVMSPGRRAKSPERSSLPNKTMESIRSSPKPKLIENVEDLPAINQNARRKKLDLEVIPLQKKSDTDSNEIPDDMDQKKKKTLPEEGTAKFNSIIKLSQNIKQSTPILPCSVSNEIKRSGSAERCRFETTLDSERIFDDSYVEEILDRLNEFDQRNLLWEINRKRKILNAEQEREELEKSHCTFEPLTFRKKTKRRFLSPENFYRNQVEYKKIAGMHASQHYTDHVQEKLDSTSFRKKKLRVKSNNFVGGAIYFEKKPLGASNDKTLINISTTGDINCNVANKHGKKNSVNIDDFLKSAVRTSHNMYCNSGNAVEMVGTTSTRFKTLPNKESNDSIKQITETFEE